MRGFGLFKRDFSDYFDFACLGILNVKKPAFGGLWFVSAGKIKPAFCGLLVHESDSLRFIANVVENCQSLPSVVSRAITLLNSSCVIVALSI